VLQFNNNKIIVKMFQDFILYILCKGNTSLFQFIYYDNSCCSEAKVLLVIIEL